MLDDDHDDDDDDNNMSLSSDKKYISDVTISRILKPKQLNCI